MKLKTWFMLALFCLVCGLIVEKNRTEECAGINVSHESGFYSEPFFLEITSKRGYEIYYTLDGSEPNRNSIRYKEPIYIDDASANANYYSVMMNVSPNYEYVEEKARIYHIPEKNVDKCTILRAVAYKNNKTKTEVINRNFWVGTQKKIGYKGLYTVSIIADEGDLFGEENGIYVMGNTFKQEQEVFSKIKSEGEELPWYYPYWWWWKGNYSNRGREWERRIVIDIFDEDKERVTSQVAGIRIKGGGSRGFAQKSLNVFFRTEYSGSEYLTRPIFEDRKNIHSLTLFTGGDDNRTKLKDYFMNTVSENLAFSTMNFIPCNVFINGEYWGVYFITERYDKSYFREHYGIDDVTMIKNGSLEIGESIASYHNLIDYFSENDLSNEKNYEYAINNIIDVESCIDYYAAEMYIGRKGDWPGSNIALWKSNKKSSMSPYEDGKWRWMLFDVNSGGATENSEHDTINTTMDSDTIFCALMSNSEFRSRLKKRFIEISNTNFQPSYTEKIINQMVLELSDGVKMNGLRYYGSDNDDELLSSKGESLKKFFRERQSVMTEILKNY